MTAPASLPEPADRPATRVRGGAHRAAGRGPVTAPAPAAPGSRRARREAEAARLRAARRPRRAPVAAAGALGVAVLVLPITVPALQAVAAADRERADVAATALVVAQEEEGRAARAAEVRRLADEAAASREQRAADTAAREAAEAELASRVAAAGAMADRVSRSEERSALPGCSGVLPEGTTSAPNGQLPADAVCALWDDEGLRADVALSFVELSAAFEERFGERLALTDGYRSLAEQHAVAAERPGFAAEPGTSDHGWGLAVDLGSGVSTGSGERYAWMREHAPSFGWENPTWAQPGGSGPTEPWHWEHVEGVAAQTGVPAA